MVSFSLYLSKIWSPVTNYKNSKKGMLRRKQFDNHSSIIVDEETIEENLETNMDEHEIKLINALKIYLGHLKRFKIKVNSINRFGYSLLDINSYLTASNKNLENHIFFILIKKAALHQNDTCGNSAVIHEVESQQPQSQQQQHHHQN